MLDPMIHSLTTTDARPPSDARTQPGKEWTIPFLKLTDSESKGSSEYFIRPELIREADIGRSEQGKIVALDIYLLDGNYQVREDSAFTFKDEAAEAPYAILRPFLNTL